MKILLKHVGGIGDFVFFVPPLIESLKKKYPHSSIDVLTTCSIRRKMKIGLSCRWPFIKRKHLRIWGEPESSGSGYCIDLIITNPFVDKVINFHSSKKDLDGNFLKGYGYESHNIQTWNKNYLNKVLKKNIYDKFLDIDSVAINRFCNPLRILFGKLGEHDAYYSNYKIYTSQYDKNKIDKIIRNFPRPRILLCEGIDSLAMRAWTNEKVASLSLMIQKKYSVNPIWFGKNNIPVVDGKPLTIREHAEFARRCDVAIGNANGPLHLAASVGVPTILLLSLLSFERVAPEYHLNPYITNYRSCHMTIHAPECDKHCGLKPEEPCDQFGSNDDKSWISSDNPGQQSTKSCAAAIGVETVFDTLVSVLKKRGF
ncbi:MAG: hypothetical protein M1480_17140 [Bacteroidetes bacterium]|nr:hypothetical protein [Bacteroidota bacterium]